MFILLIIPLVVWAATADRWHPWLVGAIALAFIVYLAVSFCMQIRQASSTLEFGQQRNYHWRREWSAASFKSYLDRYLRLREWRVLEGAVVGLNAVILIVEMKRCRAALVCVRPPHAPTQDVFDALSVLCRSTGASKAALISKGGTKAPDPAGMDGAKLQQMRFSDIPKIEYLLGIK